MLSGTGGMTMKTKEIKKVKTAARKTVKSGDHLKGRDTPKVNENVCTQSEPAVSEVLCCCEEVCC